MTEAEQVHEEKIVSNVRHMQAKADEAVTNLRERLAKLHAIALSAVAGAGGIAASEAELYGELSKEKLARADLQAQLDRLKAEHSLGNALKTTAQSSNPGSGESENLRQQLAALGAEHSKCPLLIAGLEEHLVKLDHKLVIALEKEADLKAQLAALQQENRALQDDASAAQPSSKQLAPGSMEAVALDAAAVASKAKEIEELKWLLEMVMAQVFTRAQPLPQSPSPILGTMDDLSILSHPGE